MSTPVITDKWAGNFDCDFCRRKRLIGDEFSKKALERYRKNGGTLKCKQCTQQQEEVERQVAAAKRAAVVTATAAAAAAATTTNNNDNNNTASDSQGETLLAGATCQKDLTFDHFNKNQWNKGRVGKARCRTCVEQALKNDRQDQIASKEIKLQDAKDNVTRAQASGSASAILKAESELAALEAEIVTGLKPIRMNRKSGRGTGRSNGRGRGGRC